MNGKGFLFTMPDLMRIPSKTAIIRLDGVSTNALTHPNGARTTSSPSLTDECHDTRNKRWVRPLASMNCKNGSLSVHLFIPSVQSRAPNDNVIHKLIAIILLMISDMNIIFAYEYRVREVRCPPLRARSSDGI